MPETQWQTWLEALGLSHRHAPDFFLSNDSLADVPYAHALRVTFNEGLDAVFSVNGAPTVGFLFKDRFDPNELQRLHEKLWNQGMLAMLVVLAGNDLLVFSLTQKSAPSDLSVVGTSFDPRFVEHLNMLVDALEIQALIHRVESGSIFTEKADAFRFDERIDQVLLDNLNASINELTPQTPSAQALPMPSAQALLMQSMLIAYLEDREILTPHYFLEATGGNAESWDLALERGAKGDCRVVEQVFFKLNHDFNGSAFLAPGSFSDREVVLQIKPQHCSVLRRFRRGNENMSTGQFRLLSYDFRYIPVALISAVYNNFLDAEPGERRHHGAYYTPLHLVDLTVEQAWRTLSSEQRLTGHVLDPACGSGVFLVRLFQRFVEHRSQKGLPLDWDDLLSTVMRLHGVDTNETAVKLAAISLYIALLEQRDPSDIRMLMTQGRMLPRLVGAKSLMHASFFDESVAGEYSLIIGNPPWSSRRTDDTGAMLWASRRRLPVPGNELAWAFIWKCGEHLKHDGMCALLLPAMGVLHNAKSESARLTFFRKHRALRVINLSDLRFVLFDGATRPTALMLFTRNSENEYSYSFEYWTPKADFFAQRRRAITLTHADQVVMPSRQVQDRPDIFTQRFWLRSRGERLLQYLHTFEPLSSFVDEYGELVRRKAESRFGWIIGQGFNQANEKRLGEDAYVSQLKPAPEVLKHQFIHANMLTPLVVGRIDSGIHTQLLVYRRNFVNGFKGPHILIKQGVSNCRVVAAFTTQDLAFIHSIQAVKFPVGDDKIAKIVTAVLNSRLAAWFYFLTASTWSSERDAVRQSELLALPFPSRDDFISPGDQQVAGEKIVRIMECAENNIGDINSDILSCTESCGDGTTRVLSEIDSAVYDLYGLSGDERIIVDDFFNSIIPSSQPTKGVVPPLCEPCNQSERLNYALTLRDALAQWFPDASVAITSPAKSADLVILRLQLDNFGKTTEYAEQDFVVHDLLERFWEQLPAKVDRNFQLIPNARMFLDGSLYLVKPTKRRYWLKSSALEDADGIVADLHQAIVRERRGLSA